MKEDRKRNCQDTPNGIGFEKERGASGKTLMGRVSNLRKGKSRQAGYVPKVGKRYPRDSKGG